jgi:hypothetical protein
MDFLPEKCVMASGRDPAKRSKIFSEAIYLEITRLVDQGLSAAEIADRIGCKLGTLRVKCSQYGISLRRQSSKASSETSPHFRLSIPLSHGTALRLQKHAKKERTSSAKLAAELLEAIARDDLYGAVLDRDKTDRVVVIPRHSKRRAG